MPSLAQKFKPRLILGAVKSPLGNRSDVDPQTRLYSMNRISSSEVKIYFEAQSRSVDSMSNTLATYGTKRLGVNI